MMKETLFNQQSQTTKLLQLLTLFMMLLAPKGAWAEVIFDGGGNGTADSPYKIKTATDVLRISTWINDGTLAGDEYFVLDDDLMHVDCQNLQGFKPIGTTEHPFKGVLDGRGIGFVDLVYNSSESTGYSGLFGVIDGGTVKNLRLARCTFTGGTYSGAIVGYLKDGLIDNCFVTTCTVTTGNASSVAAGGVAGWAAKGTINDCKVYYGTGTTISGVSTATGTAGASNVGGIVGLAGTGGAVTISSCLVTGVPLLSKLSETERLYAGGILGNRNGNNSIVLSGNKVSNGTTVSCQSVDDNDGITFYCGAIVGYLGNTTNATLTNNTYEYNVTTSTKKGNDDADEKEGYDQRGTGVAIDIQGVIYFDIEENDGAVLYTKKLTMPEESPEGNVMLDPEGEYYDYATEGNAILVAPGQPVMLIVTPGENLFVSGISVTYGTDQTAEIELTQTEDGEYFYTINEMPDADATVNVTYEQIEDYGISVAGVAVTNANANNIFWDNDDIGGEFALASYDYSTNTLTMNGLIGTEISGGANGFVTVYNGAESLNINLIGYNKVGNNFEHLFSAESPCTINFTTGAIPGKLEYFGETVTDDKVTLLAYGNSGLTLKEEGNIATIESSNGTEDICYFGTGLFMDDGSSPDENYPTHDYSRYEWYYSNAVKTNNNGYLAPTVISSEGVSKMRPSQGTDVIGSLIFQCVPVYSEAAITVKLMSLDGETEYATGTLTDGVVTLIPSPAEQVTFDNACLTFSSTASFSFVPMAVKTGAIVPGWTTYYNADADIYLPENVAAYIVTGVGANTAIVTQIKYVPKGIPVLLNQQNEPVASTDNINTSNNMLKHAADAINDVSTLNGTVFGLYNGSFMRVTGSISAGKNYLYIPNPMSGAPRLAIVFENDGNMTGISDAKCGNDNGQNDEWYTLNGQKLLQKPAVKGLYIKNGKKVVVNNK